ncbi:tyrosine-type recombinase/integrase [Paramicrobacterium agarici]|uniref:tyrosine-type recombinase/integrase n=1 Tax=Paramicrobacterium agarici TaxID=630514 RepID=UPI0014768287|nr:site-specific integrase [Microbacterium agarici]
MTAIAVADFYDSEYDHARSQARNVMTVLRQVCDRGYRLGLMRSNFARDIKLAPRTRKQVFAPTPMALDELRDAIVAYRERPDRMGPKPNALLEHVVEVILGTSCRISEAVGLRWEDVDIVSPVPTVSIVGQVVEGHRQEKHWAPVLKTRTSARVVPIPDHLVAVLMERKVQARAGSQFVFETRTGKPNGAQDVHRALRAVRAWAGISDEMVPHSLRKAVATTVSEMAGLKASAAVLGHSETRVTEDYYVRRALQAPDIRFALDALAPGASRWSVDGGGVAASPGSGT